MEVREISSADLIDDRERFTKPRLAVENPDGGFLFYLTNELATFHSREKTFEIPIFWADPDREKSMDYLWSKYPDSVKFIVKDKPRLGYVGYVRVT